MKNLKNARRDKLSNYNNNSVDKEILKMKQFLVNSSSSSNDLNGREILGLLEGKKEELVKGSERDY